MQLVTFCNKLAVKVAFGPLFYSIINLIPLLLVFTGCRRVCGFQNLLGTSVYGGHTLSLLGTIGLRWKPKQGGDHLRCPTTGAPVESLFKITSFLDKTTLKLRNRN